MINYQKEKWMLDIDVYATGEVGIYAKHPKRIRWYGDTILPDIASDMLWTTFESRILKVYFKVLDYCNDMNKQIEESNAIVEKVINI